MKKRKGFTLIELLVTITIIGILAVGGIQVYSSQIKKARDSTRMKDLTNLNTGVIQYDLDNGKAVPMDGILSPNRNKHFRNSISTYVPNVEDLYDPSGVKSISCLTNNYVDLGFCAYRYRVTPNGDGYKLYTTFESRSNICGIGQNCISQNDNGRWLNALELGNNMELYSVPPTPANILAELF